MSFLTVHHCTVYRYREPVGLGEHRAKPVPPEPYGLVANVDATIEEQVLDVALRQRVARQSGLEKPSIKIGKSSRSRTMIDAPRHERKGVV